MLIGGSVKRFRIGQHLQIASKSSPCFVFIFLFNMHKKSYAKQRLTALHPNIMVQRSPSHFQTGTYYWAHVGDFLVYIVFIH